MSLFSKAKEKVVGPKLLSAEDVLKRAYQSLVDQKGLEEISFDKPVNVIIAADGDPHRGTRYGYMTYESVFLVRFGGKVWVVGHGRKIGSYPGGQFRSEISAVDVSGIGPSALVETIREKLGKSLNQRLLEASCSAEYFYNTLALSTDQGELQGSHTWFSNFGPSFDKQFKPLLEDLAHWKEFEFASTRWSGRKKERRATGYRPETAKALAKFICETLASK